VLEPEERDTVAEWVELEDAEERADMSENALAKLRARNRSSASTTRAMSPGPIQKPRPKSKVVDEE